MANSKPRSEVVAWYKRVAQILNGVEPELPPELTGDAAQRTGTAHDDLLRKHLVEVIRLIRNEGVHSEKLQEYCEKASKEFDDHGREFLLLTEALARALT